MTKEYIKQLCEMLLKDNLTQNGKRKIVNYIEFLQQRIDKGIIEIDNISVDDLDDIKLMEQKLNKIKSILVDKVGD